MDIEDLHIKISRELGGISSTLKSLVEQAKLTNGRVRALEKFKWLFIGGLIVTNIILVPVVVHWFKEVVFKIANL